MDIVKEEDRIRRLQILEKKMRDPRNVSNVDSLLVRINILISYPQKISVLVSYKTNFLNILRLNI